MKSKRYTSVELLKGLGIVYLIGLHEWVWMWLDLSRNVIRWPEMEGGFPYFGYFGLHVLGFQVPLLAGVTFYLATVRKQTPLKLFLRRVLILLTLGYMINYLCWGIYGVLDWDVLHFVSLCMLLTFPLIRYIPVGIGVLIASIGGICALVMSNQYPMAQFEGSYLYAIIVGSKGGEHFWPLCPWFFVWTMGLVVGYVLDSGRKRLRQALLLVGGIMLGLSLATKHFHPVVTTALWGGDMFKASPFYILGICGASALLIGFLEHVFQANESWRQLCEGSFVVKMGRAILWLFLLNTVGGYHVTHWVLANFTLSFSQALAVYLGIVATTLLMGYGIAFVIHHQRKVNYV